MLLFFWVAIKNYIYQNLELNIAFKKFFIFKWTNK